jgi:Acetoacetate decarboxylase (ADC)
MPLTIYEFSEAINGFFEMPADAARKLLPAHLPPLEKQHETAVFAVTAFDFTGSEVGRYQELVLAVIVPPVVEAGGAFPQSAFHPFVVATSSEASREHAIERWHLPHFMADIGVRFEADGDKVSAHAYEGDRPILDISISAHQWGRVDHLYQCFMTDERGRYKVDMNLQGEFTEHEEETGSLTIHDHPMTAPLADVEIETFPFREMWMRAGRQVFQELETL